MLLLGLMGERTLQSSERGRPAAGGQTGARGRARWMLRDPVLTETEPSSEPQNSTSEHDQPHDLAPDMRHRARNREKTTPEEKGRTAEWRTDQRLTGGGDGRLVGRGVDSKRAT